MRPLSARHALPFVTATSLLVTSCVGAMGPAYTAREQQRFVVSGTPELSLSTFDGPIEIKAWPGNDVRVEVVKRASTKELADAIKVVSSQDGNRIRVEVRPPAQSDWASGFFVSTSRQARLIVSVPHVSDLQAHTGDGHVLIEGVSGHMEARTGDGDVRGFGLDGDILVDTGDGSIRLDRTSGRVVATTGDGAILVDGRLVAVRARSGDGSISIRAGEGSAMADRWELDTGDGSVVLYVPSGFGAELDAETRAGGVHCDGEIASAASGDAGDGERHVLRTRMGNGGPVLRVRTGDGTIRVYKR